MSTNSDSTSVSPQYQHLLAGSYSTLMNARATYLKLGGHEPFVSLEVTDGKIVPYQKISIHPIKLQGSINCDQCRDPECVCGRSQYMVTSAETFLESARHTGLTDDEFFEWMQSAQGKDVLPVLVMGLDGVTRGLEIGLTPIDEPAPDQTDT